jgi:O-antigen/teichoic acid export membrane protein
MLKRGLLGYLPVNAVQAAAGFGSIVLFTRILSPGDYGAYALAFSATSLVYLAGLTWIEAAMARFYAAERTAAGRADLYATLYRTFAAMAVATPLLAAALLAVLPLPTTLRLAVAAGVASVIARSLLRLAQERRRAAGEVKGFAVIDMAQTGSGFLIGAGLALAGWGAASPLAGAGIASALCLVFALPGELKMAGRGRFDPARFSAYLAYGGPVSLSLMMSLALATTDRFVLAADLNEAAVGAYHAGYTLANRTLEVMFVWFGMAGQPACIAALEAGGLSALRRTARDQASMMILIGLPASVGLMLVAGPLVHVMVGPALAEQAARVTPWIALSALLSGMTTQYFNSAYTLARRTALLFAVIAVPAAANLGLVLWLVPRFGIDGAVWATTASYGLGLLVSIACARGDVALPIPWTTLLKAGAATAAMALVVTRAPAPGGLAELLLKAALGASSYAVLALILDVGGVRGRVLAAGSSFGGRFFALPGAAE